MRIDWLKTCNAYLDYTFHWHKKATTDSEGKAYLTDLIQSKIDFEKRFGRGIDEIQPIEVKLAELLGLDISEVVIPTDKIIKRSKK